MIQQAKDLSPEQRMAIESLLGRQVLDSEIISVRAIEAPALSNQQKHELAEQFRKYFSEVDTHRQPGSADDAEEVLTEAIRNSRPGCRPQQ